VVIDVAGNRPIRHLRRILEPRGRLVLVGGEDGGKWAGGWVGRWLGAALVSLVTPQTLRPLTPGGGAEHLEVLAELAAAGDLIPPIDRTVGLADVPRAIDDLRAGRLRGKVIVTP
jgi:NADPH:quinone reductase-like Zn-dependent oxidoreductase